MLVSGIHVRAARKKEGLRGNQPNPKPTPGPHLPSPERLPVRALVVGPVAGILLVPGRAVVAEVPGSPPLLGRQVPPCPVLDGEVPEGPVVVPLVLVPAQNPGRFLGGIVDVLPPQILELVDGIPSQEAEGLPLGLAELGEVLRGPGDVLGVVPLLLGLVAEQLRGLRKGREGGGREKRGRNGNGGASSARQRAQVRRAHMLYDCFWRRVGGGRGGLTLRGLGGRSS